MANPIIPINEPVAGIVTGVSQAWEYQDGKKTQNRKLDDQGRPVTRVRAFGRVFGSSQEVTIEVADQVAEPISTDQAVLLAGNRLSASARGGDYGAVELRISGAEDLKIVGTAEEVFNRLAKVPTAGSSGPSSKEA